MPMLAIRSKATREVKTKTVSFGRSSAVRRTASGEWQTATGKKFKLVSTSDLLGEGVVIESDKSKQKG